MMSCKAIAKFSLGARLHESAQQISVCTHILTIYLTS